MFKLSSENPFRKHHLLNPIREVSYESYGGQDEESLASRSTILSNLSINPRSRSYTIDTLTGINSDFHKIIILSVQ